MNAYHNVTTGKAISVIPNEGDYLMFNEKGNTGRAYIKNVERSFSPSGLETLFITTWKEYAYDNEVHFFYYIPNN